MDFREKMDLLVSGLKGRLDNYPKVKETMEENLGKFENNRAKLKERIEKYRDDEFVVGMLESNLDFIDKQYESEIARFTMDLEHLEKSLPQIQRLVDKINISAFDQETFELFIDIVYLTTLKDWKEFRDKENSKGVA